MSESIENLDIWDVQELTLLHVFIKLFRELSRAGAAQGDAQDDVFGDCTASTTRSDVSMSMGRVLFAEALNNCGGVPGGSTIKALGSTPCGKSGGGVTDACAGKLGKSSDPPSSCVFLPAALSLSHSPSVSASLCSCSDFFCFSASISSSLSSTWLRDVRIEFKLPIIPAKLAGTFRLMNSRLSKLWSRSSLVLFPLLRWQRRGSSCCMSKTSRWNKKSTTPVSKRAKMQKKKQILEMKSISNVSEHTGLRSEATMSVAMTARTKVTPNPRRSPISGFMK
mmetsp:Transcript_95515/g.247362  ORF Transcript_95515/g.247362 Transcript_95515/m.247362 type:complete len:280 (+) Transcript_95515:327-1166(+)